MKGRWTLNLDFDGCDMSKVVREKVTKFRSCLMCKKDELKPEFIACHLFSSD